MAMEKPLVASDVGGVRELVGDAGLIVPAKNAESLADAMLATMRLAAQQRSESCKAGRKRIETAFSIEANADLWEDAYRVHLAYKQA
jgi:glycosyltransferase involved in cell wall biosynthesis